MLPMLYRPASNGAIVPRDFQPPPPLPDVLEDWQIAAAWAQTFWRRASQHADISAAFRAIAQANQLKITQLRERFG